MAISTGGLFIGLLKPILFVLIFTGMAYASNRWSGRRAPRDYDLIARRLHAKGFKERVFIDLILFLVLSVSFGFLAYAVFHLLSTTVGMPADTQYSSRSGFMLTVLASMFVGLTAPAFVYVPVMKSLHGKSFRKAILYSMASQGVDLIWVSKVLILPLFVIAFFVGLGGVFMQDYIVGSQLVERGFLSVRKHEHSLLDVEEFYVADKTLAMTGREIAQTRIVLRFSDGHVWESDSVGKEFPTARLRELERHIYHISKVEPEAVSFSPFD